jgi:hypothetical protein
MQLRFTQFLVALRSAQQFLDANDAALGTINSTGARTSLNAMAEEISQLADVQDGFRVSALNARRTELKLVAALRRKFMKPIAKIALATLPKETELGNIRLTPANATTMSVVSRARVMANFADAHASAFVDLGPDLGKRVRDAAAEVEKSITSKRDHRSSRVGATRSIHNTVTRAFRAVGVLDALVKARFDPDDAVVVTWRNAVQMINRGIRGLAAPAAPAGSPPVSTVPTATEAPSAKAG